MPNMKMSAAFTQAGFQQQKKVQESFIFDTGMFVSEQCSATGLRSIHVSKKGEI
jgi:hypothetical protein